MANSSLQPLTVLSNEHSVPGSIFKREPEEYTVKQLKLWLECSGEHNELVKCVRDCASRGNHHTLDLSIHNGKWLASKTLKERSDVQGTCNASSVPFIPSSGWHVFPSHNIPSLFNYGHDIDGLGHD